MQGLKLRKVNSNRFDMEMNLKLNLLVKPLPSELLLSTIDMRRIATRFFWKLFGVNNSCTPETFESEIEVWKI